MELEYKDYYLRTIDRHKIGIKLVLGGTGLGKTHGLREAIKECLNNKSENNKKFIYITNRHNLITEQKRELEKVGIKRCYLKSNKEIILDLFKGGLIKNIVYELEKVNFFKFDETPAYKRNNKFVTIINGIESKLNLLIIEKNKNSTLIRTLEQELNTECNKLFKIFKTQFTLIGRKDAKLHNELKSNKLVHKLFPYVEFENSNDSNVLLTTIHKVMLGFFDGKKDIKIASVENKIIFLDEFDFLEQEIIKILCNEPSIINPLEFVRIFYEKFKHWSTAEFWDSTDTLKGVRDKFNDIIKYLDTNTKKKGLNFPGVIDFRLENNTEERSRPYLLFQTNEIITPKKFFLKEKNNSWYIQDQKTSDSILPFDLFNILAIATYKILGVFHYYQKDLNLVLEIIQTIWNQKNDNTGGRYEDYINENCLYHRTRVKTDNESGLRKEKSPYEIGFRLVKLAKRKNSFDPHSAELGQIELITSPEALIAKLSDSNLVFALSATTDIPRTLKCFNIDWLEKNASYIPLDGIDYDIIKTRRDKKRDKRKTNVSLRIADQLTEEHSVGEICKNLFNNEFFAKENDLDNAPKPRYERVLRIFDTLYKCTSGNKFSHLIFVTTFKEFKEIIDYKSQNNSWMFNECDSSIFSCSRYNPENDNFFKVTLNGKDCSVLLLNSEDAKKLQDNSDFLENYKKCFESQEKVIVITQYKSASNGINLPCFGSMGTCEQDFEGIHLLEQNHFWFDNSDEIDNFKIEEKQALWYLWKLMDAGQIDSSQFKSCLGSRDTRHPYKIDIRKANRLYKEKTDEKILNSIALYHQALGRIERRDEEVQEVEVTLDWQVFEDFYLFVSSERFKELVRKRESITSSLILNVHQAVLDEAKKLNLKLELNAQKSIADKNAHSKEIVNEMLTEISKVREGLYDKTVSTEVKKSWTELREALLKHDFDKKIDFEVIGKTLYIKRDFSFETKFINQNNELYIDTDKLKVYREQAPSKVIITWNLNSAYRIISKHLLLCYYFEKNGYKTSFDIKPNIVNFVLTPYIYQAILLGAIGEQAISFLLTHNGILLENFNELDDPYFETVDAKVKGQSIYFDFKNYGQNTIEKFALSPDDVNYDAELNSEGFIEKIKLKYNLLKKHSEKPILYILNLYSEQKRKPDFFNEHFEPVIYEKDSCIRIIPSVLNPADPGKLSPEFEASLKLLNGHETTSL